MTSSPLFGYQSCVHSIDQGVCMQLASHRSAPAHLPANVVERHHSVVLQHVRAPASQHITLGQARPG
jgi:hypothetical protein